MASLDQQIADLEKKTRQRRNLDTGATLLAGGACVTVLATWGLGYFSRGWLRTTDSGVFDTEARKAGDYFLSDWLFGCSLVLAALAAFLVLRPWSHRLGRVLFGVLIGAGVASFLLPHSMTTWHQAEAKTAGYLLSEPYPFSDHYVSCGSRDVSFTSADGIKVTWSLFLTRYTSAPSEVRCDHAVLYKGWQKLGNVYFPAGSYERSGGLCCSTNVTVNEDQPIGKTRFLVTFSDGKTMTVKLKDFQ